MTRPTHETIAKQIAIATEAQRVEIELQIVMLRRKQREASPFCFRCAGPCICGLWDQPGPNAGVMPPFPNGRWG